MADYKQLCIEILRAYDEAPTPSDFMDTDGYGCFERIPAALKLKLFKKQILWMKPMTKQHPLTDDIIWSMWSESDRSALAEEKLARAAADWRLEQVIEQWEQVNNSNWTDMQVVREFDKRLKAMRPQQQQENN